MEASREAMELASSLRREMPVLSWRWPRASLSALKAGWRRRSMEAAKTESKSALRQSQLREVEAMPPPVSMLAALAASCWSNTSPDVVAVPEVRQAWP